MRPYGLYVMIFEIKSNWKLTHGVHFNSSLYIDISNVKDGISPFFKLLPIRNFSMTC